MGTRHIPVEETTSLISTSKVGGTDVYNTEGEHIGFISDVMIDKRSGRVAYAVLTIGAVLGLGGDHQPVPWAALKYDTRQGGYVTGVTIDQLQDAPPWPDEQDVELRRAGEQRLHGHYGLQGYWVG
ncbi:PRC-barrel domain-containing protein [Roseixanthobacter glucoisosaccharinicivorans]|uniref:PRC-barrel domain-containing protein n=1 Tax=Roseixanthobacter glucoisosaccharinicivorans TaxID=3119923 RepID=UPI003729C219